MEKNNKTAIGTILIIIAGCFWGSMGIFVRRLEIYGFYDLLFYRHYNDVAFDCGNTVLYIACVDNADVGSVLS